MHSGSPFTFSIPRNKKCVFELYVGIVFLIAKTSITLTELSLLIISSSNIGNRLNLGSISFIGNISRHTTPQNMNFIYIYYNLLIFMLLDDFQYSLSGSSHTLTSHNDISNNMKLICLIIKVFNKK